MYAKESRHVSIVYAVVFSTPSTARAPHGVGSSAQVSSRFGPDWHLSHEKHAASATYAARGSGNAGFQWLIMGYG